MACSAALISLATPIRPVFRDFTGTQNTFYCVRANRYPSKWLLRPSILCQYIPKYNKSDLRHVVRLIHEPRNSLSCGKRKDLGNKRRNPKGNPWVGSKHASFGQTPGVIIKYGCAVWIHFEKWRSGVGTPGFRIASLLPLTTYSYFVFLPLLCEVTWVIERSHVDGTRCVYEITICTCLCGKL